MKYLNNKLMIFLFPILTAACSLWPLDPPDTPESNFEILWHEYNIGYALFEEKGVDWNQVYKDYRPLVNDDTGDEELFGIFSTMLGLLNDTHIKLSSPFDFYKSGKGYMIDNTFSMENIRTNYLLNWEEQDSGFITSGYAAPEIGYIHISTMISEDSGIDSHEIWVEDINPILEEFKNTKGLIVDVRNNGGGLVNNATYLASRFSDQKRVYQYYQTKNGPGPDDFSELNGYYIEPSSNAYTKPVILLTNGLTASAAEDFTMAMTTIPSVTHVGAPTMGIMSLSLKRELPNGWTYTVSVQKALNADKVSLEGIGVIPASSDIIYNTMAEKKSGTDRQLEEAISRF